MERAGQPLQVSADAERDEDVRITVRREREAKRHHRRAGEGETEIGEHLVQQYTPLPTPMDIRERKPLAARTAATTAPIANVGPSTWYSTT